MITTRWEISTAMTEGFQNSHTSARRVLIKPVSGWGALPLRELWQFRDLMVILIVRDIKLRYKQTGLGILWVILQPLIGSLIFAVIFGGFAELPSDDAPYLLFVFAGLLPWNIFSGALQRAGNSLISDSRLISKVYFPRMSIPIASSAAVLVDFAVALVVMFVLMLLFRYPITLNVLLLPIFILAVLLNAVGVSLLFSALNVYYRDFMYALPFLVQVFMYASPVVYATSLIKEPFNAIYMFNPMVGVINAFRWALLGTGEFPAVPLLISFIVGMIIFLVGAFVFQRIERNFADVV